MSSRTKTIIAGVFFSVLLLVGAAVAILTAYRQATLGPVAPTVPQVIPHAEAPATPSATPACTLTFSVASPQAVVCDNLTVDHASGTAPFTANFTLSGHTTGGGSVVNYKFDFGDGTTPVGQSSPTISHTFTNPRTFTIKGTVADNLGNIAGGSGSCTQTVTVNQVVYKYKKCENYACKQEDCVPNSTDCSSQSTCQGDSDCQPKYQHKVCLGSSCSSVDCSPPTTRCSNSCNTSADCVSAPPVVVTPPPVTPPPVAQATHRECRNRACVVVTGAGTDSCTSDVSCQPAAAPPPIPRSGNTAATIGGIVLGVGAVVVGLLILL